MSVPSLDDRIQALPQELQDGIVEAFLAVDSSATVKISPNYKPPMQLQVNRRLRSIFAKTYYSNSTFQFKDHVVTSRWLLSLEFEHRACIQNIRYILPPFMDPEDYLRFVKGALALHKCGREAGILQLA